MIEGSILIGGSWLRSLTQIILHKQQSRLEFISTFMKVMMMWDQSWGQHRFLWLQIAPGKPHEWLCIRLAEQLLHLQLTFIPYVWMWPWKMSLEAGQSRWLACGVCPHHRQVEALEGPVDRSFTHCFWYWGVLDLSTAWVALCATSSTWCFVIKDKLDKKSQALEITSAKVSVYKFSLEVISLWKGWKVSSRPIIIKGALRQLMDE